MREYILKTIAYSYVFLFIVFGIGGILHLLGAAWSTGIESWIKTEGLIVIPLLVGLYFIGFYVPGVHPREQIFGSEKMKKRLGASLYTNCRICQDYFLGPDLAICGNCSKVVCTENCSRFLRYSLDHEKRLEEPEFFCQKCIENSD